MDNEVKKARLPAKPLFFDICIQNQFDYSMLQVLADLAGVPLSTVETMFAGYPVPKEQAQAVLVIVSQHIGKTYTIDNVNVPLLPIEESEVRHG